MWSWPGPAPSSTLHGSTCHLPSGGTWHIAPGDILLTVGLGLLFFEILKATRTGGATVIDHAFSMMVFVACLILFLIWDRAATSTFFLLMLMAMTDVIAGFSVTINAARRDDNVGAPVTLWAGPNVDSRESRKLLSTKQ